MELLRRPISASDRIPDRFYVISMEFLSLSRRRSSCKACSRAVKSAAIFQENFQKMKEDKYCHSTNTSASSAAKKVILITLLLDHTRIFTRLILILTRGLWASDYAAKLHKNP